jgi:hypothetical protein
VKAKVLRDKLKSIDSNIEKIAISVYAAHESNIADLNKEQLMDGIDANGRDMPSYVANSRSRYAPSKIKLRDTGRFQEGIKADANSKSIDITSTDPKVRFLENYRGKNITLGLTPKSIMLLNLKVLPKIQAEIKRLLS